MLRQHGQQTPAMPPSWAIHCQICAQIATRPDIASRTTGCWSASGKAADWVRRAVIVIVLFLGVASTCSLAWAQPPVMQSGQAESTSLRSERSGSPAAELGYGWQSGKTPTLTSVSPVLPFSSATFRHSCLAPPNWFQHGDPDDPGRHVGLGSPLVGTSWLNRPFHAGWQWGWLYGDALIQQRVEQGDNMLGGYQLGWDFDHYWGTEARFCVAHPDAWASQDPLNPHAAQDQYWDMHLLYYPWGDARWRPFVSVGFGWANFRFQDESQQRVDDTVYAFPIGAGIKYLLKPWLALRLTASDNLALGAYHLSTMHNVSLSGGVEVHFGGSRTLYHP